MPSAAPDKAVCKPDAATTWRGALRRIPPPLSEPECATPSSARCQTSPQPAGAVRCGRLEPFYHCQRQNTGRQHSPDRPKLRGKTAVLARNDRPCGWKRNEFQTEKAHAGTLSRKKTLQPHTGGWHGRKTGQDARPAPLSLFRIRVRCAAYFAGSTAPSYLAFMKA